MKGERKVFGKRSEVYVRGFARHVIPRGGKYEKGADDDPELVDRLDWFAGALDRLSQVGMRIGFFHINYMNTINVIITGLVYWLAVYLLMRLEAPWYVWVIMMIVLTALLVLAELFQSLHFGLEPLYKMDEEKGEAFLESLERSKIPAKRQLFMALKGMVCMAFYSSEDFEKFIGVWDHYRNCGGEK